MASRYCVFFTNSRRVDIENHIFQSGHCRYNYYIESMEKYPDYWLILQSNYTTMEAIA